MSDPSTRLPTPDDRDFPAFSRVRHGGRSGGCGTIGALTDAFQKGVNGPSLPKMPGMAAEGAQGAGGLEEACAAPGAL